MRFQGVIGRSIAPIIEAGHSGARAWMGAQTLVVRYEGDHA